MKLKNVCLIVSITLLALFVTDHAFGRLRVVVRPHFPRAIIMRPCIPPPTIILTPSPRPASSTGYLELSIIPKDSDVYVNEVFMGKASRFTRAAEYISLPLGSHAVSIRRKGFKAQDFIIQAKSGRVVELDVTLKLAAENEKKASPSVTYEVNVVGTGNLSFNVEPADAALYVNGNLQGAVGDFSESSAALILRAGKHKVDIVKPGHESYSITTEIIDGKIKEIVAKLKKVE